MTGSEIRAKFLEYFEEQGHTAVASSSLVPHDDPTLLFTNAGMNQFKEIFLGKASRPYTRATTCQKVVRAGGKHNDLENVGRTARHHTFFEMLGNFSFGDYFKKEAISYAWDFLTRVLALPKDRLFVTVYKDDDEAFNLWRDMIGLGEDKILRKGEKDNFWQMGDTGPCGPCSEIHIDQGPAVGCLRPDCNPDCECDRHLELWNLVFMQYNRDDEGTLHPLPKPSIDTGMGLERIAAVVQQVTSNYDTDLILPIIDYASRLAGITYGEDDASDVSLRVIADHARSTTFLISDGVLPSNEGRGYVLRRIMRRAMRHGYMLGMDSVFLYKVCLFVIDFMKGHYIELADKTAFVEKVVMSEEEAFSRTLNSGMRMIHDEIIGKLPEGTTITGEMIFKLYDTHGFPTDLLQDVLEDAGFAMDMEGFNQYMAEQQEKAKKAILGIASRNLSDTVKKAASLIESEFIGYDELEADVKVLAIIEDDKQVDKAVAGEIELIFDRTPFYPEGGGQVGDTGDVSFSNGHMSVTGTYKVENAIVHKGRLLSGTLSVGDSVHAAVDKVKRQATERNHTATHLLHKALQQVLGPHARQAGSLVSPNALRFDFTHFGQVTEDELSQIMGVVNIAIYDANSVDKSYKSQEEAVKGGATALFGEKYGDTVRVVSIGGFSQELCGGCHVDNTSKIGAFVILSESGIASGVRRIEALTGVEAVRYFLERNSVVTSLSRQLLVPPQEITAKVSELQESLREKDKELKRIREKASMAKAMESLKATRTVNGVNVVVMKLDSVSNEELRNIVDSAANDIKTNGIIVAATVNDGKVSMVCRVTSDMVDKYNAGTLVKEVAKVVDGSGGGRADMAQAGGKDPSKLDEALEKLYTLI